MPAAPKRLWWRCPAHLKWLVENNHCCVPCCGAWAQEAHHVRWETDGSMKRKPSDHYAVPLCAMHHREIHGAGERKFWDDRGLSGRIMAGHFHAASPHKHQGKMGMK